MKESPFKREIFDELIPYLYEKSKHYGRSKQLCGFKFAKEVREERNKDVCKKVKEIFIEPSVKKFKNWVDKKEEEIKKEKSARKLGREIEHIIRFLSRKIEESARKLGNSEREPSIELFVAELCLERARLIKPRGFGRFVKKEKLLNYALYLIKKAEPYITENFLQKKALSLKAEVYLELKETGAKPFDFKEVLEKAFKIAGNKVSLNVLFHLAEIINNKVLKQEVLILIEKKIEEEEIIDKACLAVLKAEVLRLEKKEKEALKEEKKALEFLKMAFAEELPSFSDPLWERALKIAKKLPENLRYEALKTIWNALKVVEEYYKYNNLSLLWYWSRVTNIYKEIFKNALERNEYKFAMEVTDGLKARPMIRWHFLEKDKDFAELVEAESLARLKRYVKGKIKAKMPVISIQKQKKKPSLKPSEGTLVLHLYFEDDNGFVFMENHKGEVKVKNFSVANLYNVYKQLVVTYRKLGHESTGFRELLTKLVEEMGNSFKFLWEIEGVERLIFIPYGFLHFLPFHSAWLEGKGFLFERVAIGYLPARSFVEIEEMRNGKKPLSGICIENLPEEDFDFTDFKNTLRNSGIKIFSKTEDVREIFENCQNFYLKNLVFISHGKADPANPFESLLKFNPPLTFKEILKMKIYPERVFLVACEADLDYAPERPIDEYLSLSTVFLAKGAMEVVGTLWRVSPSVAEKIFELFFKNKESQDLLLLYTKWLQNKIVKQKDSTNFSFLKEKIKNFIHYFPFRIYTKKYFV